MRTAFTALDAAIVIAYPVALASVGFYFSRRQATLAAIFIVWRLGWMATAMYVPCLAIDAATGSRLDIRLMILVLGILVTAYTTLGGIQAVIWNDVIQFFIMFGGLTATVWIALHHVP